MDFVDKCTVNGKTLCTHRCSTSTTTKHFYHYLFKFIRTFFYYLKQICTSITKSDATCYIFVGNPNRSYIMLVKVVEKYEIPILCIKISPYH